MLLATLARWRGFLLVAVLVICFLMLDTYNTRRSSSYHSLQQQNIISNSQQASGGGPLTNPSNTPPTNAKFNWATLTQDYPVTSLVPMPTSNSKSIPRIQHVFERESRQEKKERLLKLEAVRGNFSHAFTGYREHAWGRDEVRPLSGGALDVFGGWGASLVDSLGLFSL